jgi:glyoxylase-like metal-dependent hydrolase (beta-lactamase superfamily II)
VERIVELGAGVFALRYEFYDQQIGVLVGSDDVLVIDTRSTHVQAEELRGDIGRLTRQPVTIVVNTHGHYDHCFGNRPFRPAQIWGHVRCVAMLQRTGEQQRAVMRRQAPRLAAELDAVVIDPPDRTIDDVATLDLGGRRVELRYLGRGHTDNDIVVRLPDDGVLFAGDLLENGAPPYFADGYPIDWPATVESLTRIVPDVVVPGHGDVADRAFVGAQLEAFRAVADRAREVHSGATGLEDAIRLGPFGAARSREPIERALAQLRGELD